MDFKGRFAMVSGHCYPLTVLDDHSRFALGVEACADQQEETVRGRLTNIFRRYGMPQRMLMDNGSPWGYDLEHPHTSLTVWLMWLGIGVSHGRPYHPQTQGKDERFHRTLDAELLSRHSFRGLEECQEAFDHWRDIYNLERPHQALDYATPASRYQLSPRQFPEVLPPLEYEDPKLVRRVDDKGKVHFKGRAFRIGKAFVGMTVALRPTVTNGVWDVLFSHHTITQVDFRCSD
jgi:transposase InsO family protein